jgi:hypothetical protein
MSAAPSDSRRSLVRFPVLPERGVRAGSTLSSPTRPDQGVPFAFRSPDSMTGNLNYAGRLLPGVADRQEAGTWLGRMGAGCLFTLSV